MTEKKYNADYFDENYFKPGNKSSYALPFTWENEKENCFKNAREIIRFFHPKRVLEIGAAKGFLLKALLELDPDIYCEGCDISQWIIDNKQYVPELEGKIKYCDIRDGLPYDTDGFDLIVSMNTLEHIEEEFLPRVIRDICRVSSRAAYIEVPTSLSLGNKPWGDPTHVSFMSDSWWIQWFFEFGFLVDLRRSRHYSEQTVFQGANLSFFKEQIPSDKPEEKT